MFYLFISPPPISVTLWAASISGCLRSPGNIDAKSPLASVKQSGGTFAPAPLPCSRSLRLILNSITIFHIHLFSFSLVAGFSFFILPSPSISTSANLTPHLVQPSSALGPLVEHPLNSGLYIQHNPLLSQSSSLTTACLSLCQEKAVPPSVNKCLISRLLVPVCLSVCLTCRQLSRRSRVAVSQVLVSVLLSVHLPVKASQIRHVNLPPGFFSASPGWVYEKVNKQETHNVYSEE